GVAMRFDDADKLAASGLRPVIEARSELVVPVVGADEPLAVIVAIDSVRSTGFSEEDQELLAALASLGAIAFQTARAFRRERMRGQAAAQLERAEAEAELREQALRRVVEAQEGER